MRLWLPGEAPDGSRFTSVQVRGCTLSVSEADEGWSWMVLDVNYEVLDSGSAATEGHAQLRAEMAFEGMTTRHDEWLANL